MKDEFLTFVVNTNGMEGLLHLVQAGFGVDLAREDVLEDAGLDTSMDMLLMDYRGAMVLTIGVVSRSRLLDTVTEILAGRGQQATTVVTDGPTLYSATDSVAWTIRGNLLTLLYSPTGRAVSLLAALVLENPVPEPADASPVVPKTADQEPAGLTPARDTSPPVRFSYRFSKSTSLETEAVDLLESMGTLGGVGHATAQFLDSCDSVSGTVSSSDRYRVEATASGCSLAPGPAPLLEPEKLVPEDTIVLVHWTSGAGTLWDRFSNVQKMLLQHAWSQMKNVPKEFARLSELLGLFRGELAVGFLGLSLTSTLETFTSPKEGLDPLFGLHLQFIVALHEGQHLDPLFAEKPLKLFARYKMRDLSTQDVKAREFCRERKDLTMCFAYALKDSVFLVVTGTGQGNRLVRTLDGPVVPLDQALFVARDSGDLTVTFKTRRLVKDLTNKGFPPYFLQLLASVLEARFTATGGAGHTRLTLEVVPR